MKMRWLTAGRGCIFGIHAARRAPRGNLAGPLSQLLQLLLLCFLQMLWMTVKCGRMLGTSTGGSAARGDLAGLLASGCPGLRGRVWGGTMTMVGQAGVEQAGQDGQFHLVLVAHEPEVMLQSIDCGCDPPILRQQQDTCFCHPGAEAASETEPGCFDTSRYLKEQQCHRQPADGCR